MNMKTAFLLLCCLPVFSKAQTDTLFKRFTLVQTPEGVLVDFTMFAGATCNGIRLERSSDSLSFETVHEFVGVCGSSTGETSYQFTDLNPIRNQIAYYRLDAGLQGLYSDLRSIFYIDYGSDGLTVFPNPCRDGCTWYINNLSGDFFDCILTDAAGRLMRRETIQGNMWQPETQSLPQGLYYYQIRRQNELKYAGKILIYSR
ncbi:MAG: T9SS type A sorting domain-containing protein [Bacteroidia bacterium]